MRTDLTTMLPLLEHLHSREPTADARGDHRSVAGFAAAVPVDTADATLPAPRLDLRGILENRESSLRYGDDPVHTALVVNLLRESLARDAEGWDLDTRTGPLEVFVFSRLSRDLEPGILRVTAQGATRLGPLSDLGELEDVGVQREFGTAAGIVTVYGNLDRSDGWAGVHGYRLLAVRAAMVIYDFQLSSQAHGLTGTIFGGYIGTAARTLLKADGVTRHPLVSATYAMPRAGEVA